MNKTCVILVSDYYCKKPHQDDVLLKQTLESLNISTDIVAWDDPSYDFASTQCAIIRSCWDYDQRIDEFLNQMKRISEKTTLINPYETIKNNSDKSYLKSYSNQGIPIVETFYLKNFYELPDILNKIPSETIIIKPAISASGRNTHRLSKTDTGIEQIVQNILQHSTVLIQPFYDTVQTIGEKSTVVINNEVVFTMRKVPQSGHFLVHTHMGGTYIPDEVSKKDESFINDVIKHLPKKTAYVRIDYLFDKDDQAKLLELELIEPNLYLHNNPKGLKLLCDYVLETI